LTSYRIADGGALSLERHLGVMPGGHVVDPPDEERFFVASLGRGDESLLLDSAAGFRAVAMHPSGSLLFAADHERGAIRRFEIERGRLVKPVEVASVPVPVAITVMHG
jgi:hypothetical protein